MKKSTQTAKWVFGYGAFLVCLFLICTIFLGLSTTIWGFAVGFTVCALGILALWRQEDRQQRNFSLFQARDGAALTSAPESEATTDPRLDLQNFQQRYDRLPLIEGELDLFEHYTQNLIKRVEIIYPQIDRHHVHAIVRTVMVELFRKRMTTTTFTTLASVLTAKMKRAA